MTPVYFVGKLLAVLGAVYTLWTLKFDLSNGAAKAALGLGVSALGSMFENVKIVNQSLAVITSLMGISYTPDPAPVVPSTPPPDQPKV